MDHQHPQAIIQDMTTPQHKNNYEAILNNFEQFCDEFEGAAAVRFSGQDNDSRQPLDNSAVERATPAVIREINHDGNTVEFLRETSIDVPSTEV